MFMSDVNKKEEIRNVAIRDLRSLGVKFRPKKQKHHAQETRVGRRVFKTALYLLPMQTVTLASGQQLIIPRLVHDLCSFILNKVETEGLFRKAGSKARQNEIRLLLDTGCSLGSDHHEIDVANVLKTFFRELPEPLLPYNLQDSFLRCMLLNEDQPHAVFLTCLLLPTEHLNTLAYFMQFLNHITQFSNVNKMDANNLAIIIGPTIFPVDEKLANNTTFRLSKTCELFKMLIENACHIGVIPNDVINQIVSFSSFASSQQDDDDLMANKRKKKRRSGSLTRMFSGLRKIVGNKSLDNDTAPMVVAPDLPMTPKLIKLGRKRKIDGGGFSHKKKHEVLQILPQGTTLSTPVAVHPNPKNASLSKSISKNNIDIVKEKRSQWILGSKRSKHSKQLSADALSNPKAFAGTKSVLERRWSAVSQAAGFRRNKTKNSCDTTHKHKKTEDDQPNKVSDNCDNVPEEKNTLEPDYVKISRTEYEEIKSRVSAIEQKISLELHCFTPDEESSCALRSEDVIVQVQTAYEKTLVETEPMSPTTDQLARRLSKELKIRRSYEQKVVRSPSARKIGSLRRRLRDIDHQNAKVQRHQSWHTEQLQGVPRVNLKRGRPNTVLTGLKYPTPLKVSNTDGDIDSSQITRTPVRSASFNGTNSTFTPSFHCGAPLSYSSSQNSNSLVLEKWASAEAFFNHSLKMTNSLDSLNNSRPSLARLRSQNAGMVLAKARLFDGLLDSDKSANSESSMMTNVSRNGIGRAQSLRCDDNRSSRQNGSPKKKHLMRSPKQNIVVGSTPIRCRADEKENQTVHPNDLDFSGGVGKVHVAALKDCNRVERKSSGYKSPKGMPQIKRSLTIRSPKRLHKTPVGNENKQTPLKIITSSNVCY